MTDYGKYSLALGGANSVGLVCLLMFTMKKLNEQSEVNVKLVEQINKLNGRIKDNKHGHDSSLQELDAKIKELESTMKKVGRSLKSKIGDAPLKKPKKVRVPSPVYSEEEESVLEEEEEDMDPEESAINMLLRS